MITLDKAIDTVLQLPLQQQEMLVAILYKRQVEARRQEIASDAQISLAEFHAGELAPSPLPEILAALHNSLTEDEAEG
ncbi:MAG: hypothetical protein KF832_05580 [Caldilineaceae bacterium]|nr:hypothetical protein [Caldilineaceae bacterium]